MNFQPLFDPSEVESISTAWANAMIAWSLKSFVLLLFASSAAWLLRRRAAATRHLVWTSAIGAMILLPLSSAWVPEVGTLPLRALRTPPAEQSRPPEGLILVARADFPQTATPPPILHTLKLTPMPPASPPSTASLPALLPRPGSWSIRTWALFLWELGALLVMAWLGVGTFRVWRLGRRCTLRRDPLWERAAADAAHALGLRRVPALAWTSESLTPMTMGWWRGCVVLPPSAREWSPNHRHEVLLHEFAHVQRRDVLSQSMAQLACALMWFHPMPWIAAGRMRLERERACDDRVLMAGSKASTYASHLLEMARSLRFESSLSAATVAMARRSHLGERMDSILDRRPRGRRMGLAARIAVLVTTLLVALPLSAMRPAPAVSEDPSDAERKDRPERVRWNDERFRTRDDREEWRVEADGVVDFAPDESQILWMEEGARFELEWIDLQNGDRRRVVFDGKGDEGFDVHYSVGPQTLPFDPQAQQWFDQALRTTFDRSGVLADRRALRWLEEGGVDAVAQHLRQLESSWTLGLYISALMPRLKDPQDRQIIVAAALDGLSTDFERARILQLVRPEFLGDDSSAGLWLGWIGNLDQDFAITQSISGIGRDQLSSNALHLALQTGERMESDFLKTQFLFELIPQVAGDPELEEAFYRVADEIESEAQYDELMRILHAAQP